MYKKMSIVAIMVLLGLSQNVECKMFEKTRARVQEKYGAWKAGRQQKREAKATPMGWKRGEKRGVLEKPVEIGKQPEIQKQATREEKQKREAQLRKEFAELQKIKERQKDIKESEAQIRGMRRIIKEAPKYPETPLGIEMQN